MTYSRLPSSFPVSFSAFFLCGAVLLGALSQESNLFCIPANRTKKDYAIVLYDAIASGAGHIRKPVTENGSRFRQVVEKAIAITLGCNCSPSYYSCLRNYYNQIIHDLLNRKHAYGFLENYSGDLEPMTNEEFEGVEELGKV